MAKSDTCFQYLSEIVFVSPLIFGIIGIMVGGMMWGDDNILIRASQGPNTTCIIVSIKSDDITYHPINCTNHQQQNVIQFANHNVGDNLTCWMTDINDCQSKTVIMQVDSISSAALGLFISGCICLLIMIIFLVYANMSYLTKRRRQRALNNLPY